MLMKKDTKRSRGQYFVPETVKNEKKYLLLTPQI